MSPGKKKAGTGRSTAAKPAAGRSNAGRKAKTAKAVAGVKKPTPWATIIAIAVVLLLAGGIFGYAYSRIDAQNDVAEARQQAAAERQKRLEPHTAIMRKWAPTQADPDPSKRIKGVVIKSYEQGRHVLPTQRVAYDQSPPFGGPHDGFWAACTGIVYPAAVRSENMVHGLEHGAVWITYNPDKISGRALDGLKDRVTGQPFTMMSPYPGLSTPLSLQSWGHQLKLTDPDDVRVDQFIGALRRNQNTYPEIGASCDALGPGQFDPDNPPPFDGSKPGPDAVPMTGGSKSAESGGVAGSTG